jgi:hypothetical protein
VACKKGETYLHYLHVVSTFIPVQLKVKVKVTLEPVTKAQRGSRGIALLFLQPWR